MKAFKGSIKRDGVQSVILVSFLWVFSMNWLSKARTLFSGENNRWVIR